MPKSNPEVRNKDLWLRGAFNNHVDKKGWVGDLKFAIFVPVYLKENVQRGKEGGQKRPKLCPHGY